MKKRRIEITRFRRRTTMVVCDESHRPVSEASGSDETLAVRSGAPPLAKIQGQEPQLVDSCPWPIGKPDAKHSK